MKTASSRSKETSGSKPKASAGKTGSSSSKQPKPGSVNASPPPKKTPTESEAPLIDLPWTVDSYIVDRTPKGEVSATRKVRVTHLRYKGEIIATQEGLMSDQNLTDLADQYNSSGKKPLTIRPCFADIPGEAARSRRSGERYHEVLGPEFTPPVKRSAATDPTTA